VSYTLTAPTTAGTKTGFSGTLEPAVGEGVEVSGPSSVTVSSPPAQQTSVGHQVVLRSGWWWYVDRDDKCC
jgi:hypothetical protein